MLFGFSQIRNLTLFNSFYGFYELAGLASLIRIGVLQNQMSGSLRSPGIFLFSKIFRNDLWLILNKSPYGDIICFCFAGLASLIRIGVLQNQMSDSLRSFWDFLFSKISNVIWIFSKKNPTLRAGHLVL